ncbi:MAG TPA: hypothetical protein VHP33_09960 [Polyangiaceae bacterium]|nr:hypothetical protein [Polyangiaceae bacterium]
MGSQSAAVDLLQLRRLVAILSVLSLVAVACGKTGKVETTSASAGAAPAVAGAGSTGGQPVGGNGQNPAETPAGSAGDTTAGAGGARHEQGSGTVVIEITGLPEGVEAEVLLTGPDRLEVTASGTLVGVTAGGYAVTAARVYAADPIVRTAFDATVAPPDFLLDADGSQVVSITYSALPSSGKLWNASRQALVAFDAGAIAETSSGDATVSISRWVGRGLAFDRDGHAWTSDNDASEPDIMRLPASALGASGEFAPDVSITVADVQCRPAFLEVAFDAAGNLWLCSSCSDQVLRLPASALGTSGQKQADARLSVADPEGLAFDRHGNLWVNNYTGLSRFDAARLGAIDPDPPDLKLSMVAPTSLRALRSTGMAFDAAGNLWSLDFPAQRLFRLTAADLAGTGVRTVEAAVAFQVTPSAISGVPAFDEGGGLWLTLSGSTPAGSHLVRIGPEQLAMSSDEGFLRPEVLITSRSVGSGQMSSLAFFPAPQGLPLFHSLPAP